MGARPRIFGIVNLTEDSFSDGGRYLEPGAALRHAHTLVDEGADVIEFGPSSTHPNARPVSPADEIRRLEPVFAGLEGSGIPLAVDAFQPETQRWALAHGADWLNDTLGFPEPAAVPELASSSCKLVVMHSVQRRGQAERRDTEPRRLLAEIESFFAERVQALVEAGVSKERLVLDPGMGFFLGSRPESSLAVLRELPGLRARFGLRLLVSVSRKFKYSGTVAIDVKSELLHRLQGRGLPEAAKSASVLVDDKGAIRWVHSGSRLHADTDGAHTRAGEALSALEKILGDEKGKKR